MFRLVTKGSFAKTQRYLRALERLNIPSIIEPYGAAGVQALAGATPVESGLAANSWTYKIEASDTSCTISWLNTDVENGFPVAIMLQFGYATGTGGYVAGRDYINPAIVPIFDQIEQAVWRAVKSVR